ncbi:hypothetical protein B0H11DRAFT_2029381 [Mycena galericulata]|nr:hypothetical protein B0H11DRAFT_2029381 [Mycena galericulata]
MNRSTPLGRRWVFDCVVVSPRTKHSRDERTAPHQPKTDLADEQHSKPRLRPRRTLPRGAAAAETQMLDIEPDEREEHHLQLALAPDGPLIPTPGTTLIPAEDYIRLYPPGKWRDPVLYVETTDLIGDDWTYDMDEVDKQWLDETNEAAGRRIGMNLTVATVISEEEFEVVMGLLERFTAEQVLTDGPPPAHIFETSSSYSPARLLCIAHDIYPHWKNRRGPGGRVRPSLNYHDKDFLDPGYICFRKRANRRPRRARPLLTDPRGTDVVKAVAAALADMQYVPPRSETPHVSMQPFLPTSAPAPNSALRRPVELQFSSTQSQQEKRLEMNRIAAQNSRARRKAQFAYLERRVIELEEENRQLRAAQQASVSAAPRNADLAGEARSPAEERNVELRERARALESAIMEGLVRYGTKSGGTEGSCI